MFAALGGIASGLLGGGGGTPATSSAGAPFNAFSNKVVGSGSASSAGDGGTASAGVPTWAIVALIAVAALALLLPLVRQPARKKK